MFFIGDREHLIVVAPERSAVPRQRLIIHEAVHWLARISSIGHMDQNHRDVRLWPYQCPDEVCAEASIERRAYRRMGL